MMRDSRVPAIPSEAQLERLVERTPARVFVGRSGAGYRTATELELRKAHAAAADAVRSEMNLMGDLGAQLVREFGIFEVATEASTKIEYIANPALGRRFRNDAREDIARRCTPGAEFQLAIGDGLSVAAVSAQVPRLLPLLIAGAKTHGWSVGQVFAIRYCRVGILNEIGELLHPGVVVLLIGERPGLATAESLSAYMAYQPRAGHTDADRNLISNIHLSGVPVEQAADRVLALAAKLTVAKLSGAKVKEDFSTQRSLSSQSQLNK
jgi:ethanolamine ammonia-lyase small subunit